MFHRNCFRKGGRTAGCVWHACGGGYCCSWRWRALGDGQSQCITYRLQSDVAQSFAFIKTSPLDGSLRCSICSFFSSELSSWWRSLLLRFSAAVVGRICLSYESFHVNGIFFHSAPIGRYWWCVDKHLLNCFQMMSLVPGCDVLFSSYLHHYCFSVLSYLRWLRKE